VRFLAAIVASVALPSGAIWSDVTPAGGNVVAWGIASPGTGCIWLTVDPRTLGARRSRGSCATPEQEAYGLAPVISFDPKSFQATVRVAGKVAFRYGNYSDTKPVWAYGGGSLWLYDVATTSGPLLLRYSLASGAVEQRIRMPKLFEPVLAADNDGAWLMAGPSGGISGKKVAALYLVRPGATAPAVVQSQGRAALWIVANRHTVWVETITGVSSFSLWRVDGTRVKLLHRGNSADVYAATYGAGGLWGWGHTAPCGGRLPVTRVDGRTGAVRVVAKVPRLGGCSQPAGDLYVGGGFWFVNGPRLYRVSG
jgi:hypothetical protein